MKNQPLFIQNPVITEIVQGQIIDKKGKNPRDTPAAPNVAQLIGVQRANLPIIGLLSISLLQKPCINNNFRYLSTMVFEI
jgi:hypothetical protein